VTENPVLEVRDLGRRFGGLHAVAELSFTVPAGQVVGVIGPNGAGKSTFVNLVTGHVKPTSGRVIVDGTDLTGARPWRVSAAGVARTFQIVKPFAGMTVRENVAVGVMYGPHKVATTGRAFREAGEVLERVGLAERGDAAPSELSVADARRLEFAKALALRPRLLLLDEVMAGLRPAEIEPSLELIRSLSAEGMTVMVIEHVMRAIVAVSDRVVVLHGGRLLTEGPPTEVLSDQRVIEAYLGHRYAAREQG
jgi:branched-chain amino acid transport system ATP-binding protein